MSSLFRKAAIESQRQRLFGDVLLAQPKSLPITTIFISIAAISVLTFISVGSYARKETVAGFLSPKKGVVKITAPATGVVDQLFASEGLTVDKGTPLISLHNERVSDAGLWINHEMRSTVEARLRDIRARQELEANRLLHEKERLTTEIGGLASEQTALQQQLDIQQELLDSAEPNLQRFRTIAAEGYISKQDLAARESAFLGNRRLLASLRQKQAVIQSRISQLRLEIDRLPMESTDRMSQLSSIESELQQNILELDRYSAFTIIAPVAGTVTAVQAVVGASVDPRLPLLTVLPAGSDLEAYLFVPTRAIGFVEIGQEVRLLYEAFDYRRFGTYEGRVAEISTAVLSPAESNLTMPTAEPTYRVTVDISRQTVAAYGQEYSLQAGMLLKADIILDSRSLLNWILDPLFSLRGRT